MTKHPPDTSARAEFDALYREWQVFRERPEVIVSSRTPDYLDSDAYRAIVAAGARFLPFIVEKLEAGDFFLNDAMRKITGVDVIAMYPDAAIEVDRDESKLWVRWWAENRGSFSQLE